MAKMIYWARGPRAKSTISQFLFHLKKVHTRTQYTVFSGVIKVKNEKQNSPDIAIFCLRVETHE